MGASLSDLNTATSTCYAIHHASSTAFLAWHGAQLHSKKQHKQAACYLLPLSSVSAASPPAAPPALGHLPSPGLPFCTEPTAILFLPVPPPCRTWHHACPSLALPDLRHSPSCTPPSCLHCLTTCLPLIPYGRHTYIAPTTLAFCYAWMRRGASDSKPITFSFSTIKHVLKPGDLCYLNACNRRCAADRSLFCRLQTSYGGRK